MVSGEVTLSKNQLDNNQKASIESQPVLGESAGEGALNTCRAFAAQHVSNPAAPVIKVCGTGIQLKAFLRGECQDYYEHQFTVGSCNTGLPPDSCETKSPAQDARY